MPFTVVEKRFQILNGVRIVSLRSALRRSQSVRSSCTGTRTPGKAGQPGGESSIHRAGDERHSRWRARTHAGGRSRVVSHLHQLKDVAKPEPCHLAVGISWGLGGDRCQRPSSPISPRNVATCPATAGASPPPACEASRASNFRRNHLHPYKGAERARTVSVTAGEILGGLKAQVRTPPVRLRLIPEPGLDDPTDRHGARRAA